jgi:hypothetical protein
MQTGEGGSGQAAEFSMAKGFLPGIAIFLLKQSTGF